MAIQAARAEGATGRDANHSYAQLQNARLASPREFVWGRTAEKKSTKSETPVRIASHEL